MLEITGLHAGYGEVSVLRGVDLVVERGEIVALLGSNGVGKSTLINNISGLFHPTSGSIRFKGAPIERERPHHIVARGLIQVPEGRRIFPNLTVTENLQLGGYRRASERQSVNLERMFELFPRLRERFRQLAGTLSGGEQQMLAIGRALMGEPELLILDEPSLGLSPLLVDEMFELVDKLKDQGLTIMLVEQNVVHTLQIAQRGYVLEGGRIALADEAAALLNRPDLQASYFGI